MSGKVTNLQEFKADLNRAVEEIQRATMVALEEAARDLKDDARRHAPVDDGDLRDAIFYRMRENHAEVLVNADKVYYGHFVEFGTAKQPEQPFMGPAALRAKKTLPKRVKAAVRKVTRG